MGPDAEAASRCRRRRAYREAGAHLIFVEAPETIEEMRQIVREVPGPLVVNMIEGGRTQLLRLETLHEMGYFNVGYVLTGIFAAARALEDAYRHLLAQGTSMGIEDRLMSFQEFTSLLGLQEKYALDERFRAG